MDMFDALFFWFAENYRMELHLGGLKIAGVLCSYADISAIWFFARICDAARRAEAAAEGDEGPRPGVWRYWLLTLFALLTPALLLPANGTIFFIAQFLVLGLPYLILIHVVVTGVRPLLARMKRSGRR
ncbi:MAG: hypothetical protein LBT31_01700 [Synergistaceae bacterium]|jgi:hypothetical protein|nr:hypothetical protein [Synergistaceae bacterium]